MARLTVNITEDIIKLLRCFKYKNLKVYTYTKRGAEDESDKYYGVDTYDLYGGTYLYEQMAFILGYADKMIPNTNEDVDGPKYEEEYMNKMIELDEYIVTHLLDLEEILHQFADRGIKAGKYVCRDNERIWRYVEND